MRVIRTLALMLFAAALSACVYGGPYHATGAYHGSYAVYGTYPAYEAYPVYGGYKAHGHHRRHGHYGYRKGHRYWGW